MSAIEVNGLEREFNIALREYHSIRQQMKTDIAKRLLSRSKYAGSNISINGDSSQTFYVTQQGMAKWYPDGGVLNATAGQNGCPAADKATTINIPWSDLYTSENYVLPTTPAMTTGTAMQSGQACGREGRNVYVSSLLPAGTHISSKYVGCYNGSDVSTSNGGGGGEGTTTITGMTQAPFTEIVSPSICSTYAAENGYKYVGLSNYNNGKMTCYVGNDLDAATQYGSATEIYTAVPTWSSSTAITSTSSAMRQMQITSGGQVLVMDTDGKVLYKSGEEVLSCGSSGGKLKITSATYGGNCSDSNVEIGNVTSKVATGFKCDGATSCNIPVSNSSMGGDPAKGCRKDFDVVYQCGGSQFTKNLSPAEGKTMVLDCGSYAAKNCVFTLVVRDNGTVSLYKGTKKDVSGSTALWTVGTVLADATKRVKNPAWISSKGKYGRNYMSSGETLAAGEWIGSPGGSAQLIMQTDGNLVLNVASVKSNCKTMADGSAVGGSGAVAVYEIPDGAGGEPGLVGKVAYVDKNSVAHVYPGSMLAYTNEYVRTKGYNSVGNDIDSRIADTEDTCKKMCDADASCAGYVYDVPKQTCYVKNSGMYPNGSRAYVGTDDFVMGVRRPGIVRNGGDGSNGKMSENGMCTSFISEDVDSGGFSKYVRGEEMTPDYKCGEMAITAEQKEKYEAAVARLEEVGQKLVKKIAEYNGRMSAARGAMRANSQQFEKTAVEYQDVLDKLRAQREEDGRQEVGGVEGFCGGEDENVRITDTTLDRMLQVSQLKVNSSDLQFWLLSFLGLSAFAFIMFKMRRASV